MILAVPECMIYKDNQGTIYSYDGVFFKLVNSKHPVRQAGYELAGHDDRKHTKKGEGGNDSKLDRNISRARQAIFELAFCNPWDYFATMTFDPKKVSNRNDLDSVMKSFGKWLNNYNSRKASGAVRYLLIPEKHKDGAWHLHGFLSGIPSADLHSFQMSEHIPYAILNELEKGNEVFSWIPYQTKFGYCTMEPIRTREGAAKYVTKYITKDLKRSVEAINAHLYYCSRGLTRKSIVYRSEVIQNFTPDFENEHVRIKQSDTLDNLIRLFCHDEGEIPYEQ